MSYKDLLKNSKAKAADHLLATKIRDLMDKLRMGNTPNAARRWIWELIQNAKDVAIDGKPINIQIDLLGESSKKSLTFRHNGKPFTTDNIYFLIQQVSTKDRQEAGKPEKKSTGKFGTGFLSTHLLSEIVTVEGIIKDEELPYKEFKVVLDRSPLELPGIINSVNNSLQSIENVLESDIVCNNYVEGSYNSSFTYELLKEKEDIAQTGITDLHFSLPYTMAFSGDIGEVEVVHTATTFKVKNCSILDKNGLELVEIQEESLIDDIPRYFCVKRGTNAAIAIEVDKLENAYRIKNINENIPRLFCDFPLVGSEKFPVPIIINSANFNPNEPRSAVWLTKSDDSRVRENKNIISEAITLYISLLEFASNQKWKGMYELVRTVQATDTETLSAEWFNNQILTKFRETILSTPVVDTTLGRVKLLGNEKGSGPVWFPTHTNHIISEHIWDLGKSWVPNQLPPKDEIKQWNEVLWESCKFLTLEILASNIQSQKNLTTLSSILQTDEASTISWLNCFYGVASLDETFEDKLINGTYSIFPNQEGNFKKREELFEDTTLEVDEAFMNVAKILGANNWALFLDRRIKKSKRIIFHTRNLQFILDEINLRLKDSKIPLQDRLNASTYLVELFSKQSSTDPIRLKLFKFSKVLFPGDNRNKKEITTHNPDIWKEADGIHIKSMVKFISAKENVTELQKELKLPDEKTTIDWISEFVSFLKIVDYEDQLDRHPILPNQRGTFCKKDALYADATIHEELKDIMNNLGHDYRTEMLNKGIFLMLPPIREISDTNISLRITESVRMQFSELEKTDLVKEAFRLLLKFFSKNSEISSVLFNELYANKHKLYDDEEIARDMDRVDKFDQFMEEYNFENLDDLRAAVKNGLSNKKGNEYSEIKQEVTQQMLAGWGVTNAEDYEQLIGSDVNHAVFRHYSKADPALYEYANTIIKRAYKNILTYLKILPEYDCTESQLLASTLIGGIKKGGRHIYIVFRPSDNEEVIIYYTSEYEALDEDNTELWIEDGVNDPINLTIGKILKITGINRIPLNGHSNSI
ncbi:sacsin N-terminal ATP-binding-like domain-containing protein [Chitinophaga deserti]|uniref:sacsin N-terminal ATP-binding-like domain-containing protein n=1 Tax=Chitinophaga deserti TaxID=2164099 RepID=UPI000D6C3618|nr:hypothetical protein [Chitinophaga deserti]